MREPRAVCATGGRRGAGSPCRPRALLPPAPHGLSQQHGPRRLRRGRGGWRQPNPARPRGAGAAVSAPAGRGEGPPGTAPPRRGTAAAAGRGACGRPSRPRRCSPRRPGLRILAPPAAPGRPCPALPAPGSQLSSAWHEMCRGAAEPL